MVEDRWDDLDDRVGIDALPPCFGAQVHGALVHPGAVDAVEGDDDRHGTRALAVGAVVVGRRVLQPVVPVRVDLRHPRHPLHPQVASRGAYGLGRDGVVPGSQQGIWDDDGRGDEDGSVGVEAVVTRLIDGEPVEVDDSLDARRVRGEQLEYGAPERVGNPNLRARVRAHGTSGRVEGPA